MKKVLIAYFSQGGTTLSISRRIEKGMSEKQFAVDLFNITDNVLPESHSLFLYEFEDKQETLLMDYSDHIGIIREEFRWERDGEFAMQTRVLRSNVSIIYSLIKKVMTNS